MFSVIELKRIIPGDGDPEGKEANALDERPAELVAVEALHELGHAAASGGGGGGGSDAAHWRTHDGFDVPTLLLFRFALLSFDLVL